MRKLRTIPALALVAALAAACEAGSRHQGGNPDEQRAGGSPERGQGTIANDTAPARPGLPPPNTVSDSAQP
ncbi:MAG TPA: hypothetical protein VF746_28495 [Longimicrobium sp.]|jgi:hypothetical protein